MLTLCVGNVWCGGHARRPIVVLYDNDVHCALDGYAKIAGLRDAMIAADTADVLMVSAGDFVQGNMVGGMSYGEDVVPIINAAGYDAMTLGNHELDYGGRQLRRLTDKLTAPVVCANLSDCQTRSMLYAPYVIRPCGRRKVAFVGVLTPQTMIAEGYSFYDGMGHQLYDVHTDSVAQLVQQAIDNARRKGADYVIVLSHLGESTNSYTSRQLIGDIHGADAVIDGHSHSVITAERVQDARGRDVVMSQTGTKFQHVGHLYISPRGRLSTSLIPTADIPYHSARVQAVLDSVDAKYETLRSRVCGYSERSLPIHVDGQRVVRSGECVLANLVTDCMREMGGGDIALTNGGGIRVDMPAGAVTFGQVFDVVPFDNELMLVRTTGARIRAMLEKESRVLPKENGMLIHPSGLRYRVRVGATPCVQAVEVIGSDSVWHPMDDEATYRVATTDYIYHQYLEGEPILISNGLGTLSRVLYIYIEYNLQGRIPASYAELQGRIVVE